MTKYICIWIFSVLISSVAQVLLKKAANQTYKDRLHEYLNPTVIGAYCIFLVSTLLTMYALKVVPYSYSPIIESLSYIFIPIFGIFILKEHMSRRRILGIAIILAGILIFTL